MIGGIHGNPVFPVCLEENQFQCDSNALTQLQLFGNFPPGIDVNPGNCAGNDHIPALSRPIKRSRETEDSSRQQNLQISFHNYCQERADQLRTFLNPNDVSTGLRLSYDDDEHNSSVTSASGSMPSLNIMMSLSDNAKNEIDRQKEELENYIRIQAFPPLYPTTVGWQSWKTSDVDFCGATIRDNGDTTWPSLDCRLCFLQALRQQARHLPQERGCCSHEARLAPSPASSFPS